MFFPVLNSKDRKDFCSNNFCKTLLVFYPIVKIEVILNLALGKSSLWSYSVLPQLLPNMLYTEWYTMLYSEYTFYWKDRLKAWSDRISP